MHANRHYWPKIAEVASHVVVVRVPWDACDVNFFIGRIHIVLGLVLGNQISHLVVANFRCLGLC